MWLMMYGVNLGITLHFKCFLLYKHIWRKKWNKIIMLWKFCVSYLNFSQTYELKYRFGQVRYPVFWLTRWIEVPVCHTFFFFCLGAYRDVVKVLRWYPSYTFWKLFKEHLILYVSQTKLQLIHSSIYNLQ